LSSAPPRSGFLRRRWRAIYFRGLGDPIRLRILELLRREGELSVGELVRRLELPQPQISNHLACLRWCGFVEARREGRTVYNRIADRRVEAMGTMSRLRSASVSTARRISPTRCFDLAQ
jgi:DNA-binding transcriptional ArsR family regulator